ncbi:hypothetical protein BGZ61DRAFT_370499 [Ilyonectria robusta]|uniref:uncharacterized protein n=1 Tax=Ilyonectria robusta TaxID=1079257 RepID=UPI001E8E46F3|nr:uncharacterized protein BGZ61DRAFT_370499 [Ilyonectria robusta]KAH8659407.1 hypothetical protein BGZ61DRAFT_370499 [Ilyonectria robusta]
MNSKEAGSAQKGQGIGAISFLTAVASASTVFIIQLLLFVLLRNTLARIFKPKTYLVPERQRSDPPPTSFLGMIRTLWNVRDQEIIYKCGLDAYFFLRYLKVLLVIFIPIASIFMPILLPLNFIDGRGYQLNGNAKDPAGTNTSQVSGLDTLAWGNVRPQNTSRYSAHLMLAILVVVWVCSVFFLELRAYIKVRQDYLTSAEHRLRASATTVLINSIPSKWLNQEALQGLFDVFPGGVRNIWLNRDLSKLLKKTSLRDKTHLRLESAETDLIKAASNSQVNKRSNIHAKQHKTLIKSSTKEEMAVRQGLEDEETMRKAVIANSRNMYPGSTNARHLDLYNKPLPEFLRGSHNGLLSERGPAKDAQNLTSNRSYYREQMQPSQWQGGTTARRLNIVSSLHIIQDAKWWQFWKPPSRFPSPVPRGGRPKKGQGQSVWSSFAHSLQRWVKSLREPEENRYPIAYNSNYQEDERDALWKNYLRKEDRPSHRLPLFGMTWLPGLPLINAKVDTIFWCRKELARLNLEIEEDQKHPESFPLLNSAFIQFNSQIAAHMACQSEIYHLPKYMTPRIIEISPRDIIWENMALSWWQEWLMMIIVTGILLIMVFLWALPIAWTAALSQLEQLIQTNQLLQFLHQSETLKTTIKAISGVLPSAAISLLLYLVPIIFDTLAQLMGAKTKSQKIEFVQAFYFIFLFIQLFLVVSIASFFTASLEQLLENIQRLQTGRDILNLLASNLPKASNYFFSYMILQALSTSSSTLLQTGALITWYVIARFIDNTPREKWYRNIKLSEVRWGSFFPIYTNFACIALVYCIIAPLISIFAIITFSLLWFSQRYMILYVTQFGHDTGGVLYPRAINQTFTGIYTMELCLAGLLFIVEDQNGKNTCTIHGIIMVCVLIATAIYQMLLNWSFAPLFRYLPITFEDDAVLRDEAFRRAHNYQVDQATDIASEREVSSASKLSKQDKPCTTHNECHEAQRYIGDALYEGINDEIEDLTPEKRDTLVHNAFQHEALRARCPTVWIPRDDLGISDDEIRRTQDFSQHILISNKGAALDSKGLVVYKKNPPDFSEEDLMNL